MSSSVQGKSHKAGVKVRAKVNPLMGKAEIIEGVISKVYTNGAIEVREEKGGTTFILPHEILPY